MCTDQNSVQEGQLSLIRARLDELSAIAKARKNESDGMFSATLGGAEISFMTPEELQERHALMLQLPTFAEDREEARMRIQARIAARKANRRQVATTSIGQPLQKFQGEADE